MTDAEYETQMARIRALIAKWHEVLGLDAWEITHRYERDNYEVNGSPNHEAVASASVQWEYMHATISWNMPAVLGETDETLEHIYVHECCHVLVHEAREWDDDDLRASLKHEERVAEAFARAIERAARQ